MKIYGKLKDYQNSKQLLEEVKLKQKNCSLILFTCFIKTCLQTKNFQEALITYESLKDFGIQADDITINTIIKGLIINKAYEYIPRIILDSLNYIHNFRKTPNYSEAINALHKNFPLARITESDLFEIRRKLALNNIYVELEDSKCENNINSHNRKNDRENQANNFISDGQRKKTKNNFTENPIFNQFNNLNRGSYPCRNNINFIGTDNNHFYSNFRNNKNFNYKNNSGFNISKKQGYNNGNNYHNQIKYNSGIIPANQYIDNFDFLINGYKNKPIHNNCQELNNNSEKKNKYSNNNSSVKKSYNKNNSNNYSITKNPLRVYSDKKDCNQSYQSGNLSDQKNHDINYLSQTYNFTDKPMQHIIQDNSISSTYNENSYLKSNNANLDNMHNLTSTDESGFFDKPSLDNYAIQNIQPKSIDFNNDLIKNQNSKYNLVNENNDDDRHRLRERSSFYKNFSNFNINSNYTKNLKDSYKDIIIQQNENSFDENIADNYKNYNSHLNVNYSNYPYLNNDLGKKCNTINNFSNSFDKNLNVKFNSNACLSYYNIYPSKNIINKNNQIFRKGYNAPIEEKDCENKNFQHLEKDENGADGENYRGNNKINKIHFNKLRMKRDSNIDYDYNYHNNPHPYNSKPVKKLTRF